MRVWYGVDVEHNPSYGKMTLFVESRNPDIAKLIKIVASLNVSIDCIYFGAGEVDITNWDFLSELYKLSDAFIVGVETSKQLSEEILNYFDFAIIRVPILCLSDKIYFKYRSDEVVGIVSIKNFNTNTLQNLVDGQYLTDVEVYAEEK